MKLYLHFDLHSSLLEVDNIDNISVQDITSGLEDWLYEDKHDETLGDYKGVKESLGITILDEDVVVRFFNETYQNANARVVEKCIDLEDVDENAPGICL